MDILTPISDEVVSQLKIGDMITLSGYIYTGRDAVLPKVCKLIEDNKLGEYNIDLKNMVIFHTAVSIAGVGPTSSNKMEIESSFEKLSEAGIKMHLGKGKISDNTVKMLDHYNSVYAVIPPVTALLESKTIEKKVVAFHEEGMEALHILKIDKYPAIIAAAHGRSIY
jgi:fumarate hydratase subunit beta